MQRVRATSGCLCQRAGHAGRTSTLKAMSTRECSNWFLRTAHRAIVKEVRWRSMRESFVEGGRTASARPSRSAGSPCRSTCWHPLLRP